MSFNDKDLSEKIEIMLDPEKYGYIECESCNGLGGDNRRVDGVPHELCEDCAGNGVVKKPEEEENDGTTCSILEEMGVKVTPVLDESGFCSGLGIVEKK